MVDVYEIRPPRGHTCIFCTLDKEAISPDHIKIPSDENQQYGSEDHITKTQQLSDLSSMPFVAFLAFSLYDCNSEGGVF